MIDAIWPVMIDELIVVELKIAAIERGECPGQDRAASTGLEPRVIIGRPKKAPAASRSR